VHASFALLGPLGRSATSSCWLTLPLLVCAAMVPGTVCMMYKSARTGLCEWATFAASPCMCA
jgi:hypothetical protein